jgi:hypothetical protein
MTQITVDPELRAKLHDFQELIEVREESGQLVGFFHPAAPSGATATSPVSDEEIEACRQQRTGRPLSEIFADLERQA